MFMLSLDLLPSLFAQAAPADAAAATAETAANIVEAVAAAADKFSSVDTIWLLLGGALVFFMHPGFTMVEAGFTRAKNTGNIAMKNVLTFALGSLVFWFIGFGLMFGKTGEDAAPYFGIIDLFAKLGTADGGYGEGTYPAIAFLFFQTAFCATAATIVSGAMAERTKFLTYCVFCAVIAGITYPISGHWVWGGGWLTAPEDGFLASRGLPGFHDFAGSTVVHMVGGISAFVGAAFLGARIGKYDANGKPRAILGSNLILGCLGVLILWFGWFGFNGASTVCATGDDILTLMGSVYVTTNLAAAAGAVATMFITIVRYGKPDISLTLNGALAGLVGITAGTDAVSPAGAVAIGAVASIFLVFGVEFLDKVLKVDDPVGAVSVHGICGAWGTLAVGLFAVDGGLFYGGGFPLLITQTIGVAAVGIFTAVVMVVVFAILKATAGLRVSASDELEGLDITEHGLASAYADFGIIDQLRGIVAHGSSPESSVGTVPVEYKAAPAKAKKESDGATPKMTKVVILTRPNKFEELRQALSKINITGMTVTQVMGCGMQKGGTEFYRGIPVDIQLRPKVCIEIVICKVPVQQVIDVATKVLHTGQVGDGKIFVSDIENVVKVRTSEEGYDALQDE
ncbi:hypothetical protein FACS189427_06800 [Planctomycetales bacterium]|nr:hypothetical protein FACS189427_06800 [Planctomycetales bacterium]